jgi:uncharacterized protein (TIRG00374 family)
VLQAIMAGSFASLTTPTAKLAGGVLRALLIKSITGWRTATSYGWALADQITNLLAYLLLVGVCALGTGLSLSPGSSARPYLLSGSGALLLLLTLLLLRNAAWRIARHPRPARWLARITPKRFTVTGPEGRSATWLEPMLRPLLQVGQTWRIAPVDLGLGAASWGSMCVASALAIRALGVDASIPSVAVALIVASVVGTISPGGVGATEAFLIAMLISMGVPGDVAAAGALLHRASYYIVILVWGGIALIATRKLLGGATVPDPRVQEENR